MLIAEFRAFRNRPHAARGLRQRDHRQSVLADGAGVYVCGGAGDALGGERFRLRTCRWHGRIDFATISQWQGHASLYTTMRYARAGMDLKRQALAHVFAEVLAASQGGRIRLNGSEVMGWLRRL